MGRRGRGWLRVAAASLAFLALQGCDPKAVPLAQVLGPLEGDWIRSDTLETLARTRSPLAAESGEVVAFTLARTKSGFDWTLYPGFHESVLREITGAVREDGGIRLEHDYEGSVDRFSLAPDAIEWQHEEAGETSRTRFVPARPSLAALVNRVVLAGEYRDAEGRTYAFAEDGSAGWPDGAGRYTIPLDFDSEECDVFVLEREGRTTTYAFRFEGARLLLFAEDDSTVRCSGAPTIALERR